MRYEPFWRVFELYLARIKCLKNRDIEPRRIQFKEIILFFDNLKSLAAKRPHCRPAEPVRAEKVHRHLAQAVSSPHFPVDRFIDCRSHSKSRSAEVCHHGLTCETPYRNEMRIYSASPVSVASRVRKLLRQTPVSTRHGSATRTTSSRFREYQVNLYPSFQFDDRRERPNSLPS